MSQNIEELTHFQDKQILRHQHSHINDTESLACKCCTYLDKFSRVSVETMNNNRMVRTKQKKACGKVIQTETITSSEKKKISDFMSNQSQKLPNKYLKLEKQDSVYKIDENLGENFLVLEAEKSNEEILKITQILKSHFLFYNLDDHQVKEIVAKMFQCQTDAGEFQFKQNSMGHSFFVINEGEVEILINDDVKKVMGAGNYFGDLALIYNAPRSASVRAKTQVKMWAIERQVFQNLVKGLKMKQYKLSRGAQDQVESFNLLSNRQKDFLAYETIKFKYNDGDHIFMQGDDSNSLYIILEGKVDIIFDDVKISVLSEGKVLGEHSLREDHIENVRVASAVANGEVTCLAQSRKVIMNTFGKDLKEQLVKNNKRVIISKSPLLLKFQNWQREKILKNLIQTYYRSNNIVFEKDKPYYCVNLFVQGALKYETSGTRAFEDFCVIAEDKLVNWEPVIFTDNVVASSDDTIISTISYDKMKQMFSNDLKDFFEKNENWRILYKKKVLEHSLSCSNREPLEIKNFKYVKNLGVGGFGTVNLVKEIGEKPKSKKEIKTNCCIDSFSKIIPSLLSTSDKKEVQLIPENKINEAKIKEEVCNEKDGNCFQDLDCSEYYALKSVPKSQVHTREALNTVIAEKETGQQVSFDFIMHGSKIGKDEEYIHFLFDFIDGMSFVDVLMELNELTDEQTNFYVCQMIFMLEYLHTNNIIYRDLKPSNFMCNTNGYLRLVDFGASKFQKQGERTFTCIGTAHYIAPEIIKQDGYSFEADYWSLGVILYEILTGFTPFGCDIDDTYGIYKEIINNELVIPPFYTNKDGIKVLKRLLNKFPYNRLGNIAGAIKAEDYFKDVNWQELLNQKIEAPYYPESIKNPDSTREIEKSEISLLERINQSCEPLIVSQAKYLYSNIPKDWDKDF